MPEDMFLLRIICPVAEADFPAALYRLANRIRRVEDGCVVGFDAIRREDLRRQRRTVLHIGQLRQFPNQRLALGHGDETG